MAVSHFSPQFQISARAEFSHVMATKGGRRGGRVEISAQAEIRHVIGPKLSSYKTGLLEPVKVTPLVSAKENG